MKKTTRTGAAIAGGLLLASVAGASFASAAEYGDSDVEVNVSIAPVVQPGVLALSVAGTSTNLTESGSTSTVRQFTGLLPTVTVTDTRTADEIPAGAGWYVLGSATSFAGSAGQAPITADHLGWSPHLIDGFDAGLVSEGDPVGTVLDSGPNAVGLVDQELLALAFDSAEIAPEGQWTATADLTLKTEANVAPGSYQSTITLSLFE